MKTVWMKRSQIPAAAAIDACSFATPMTADDIIDLLHTQKDCVARVCLDPAGSVAAFLIYRLERTVLRVVRLAVGPAHRREGYGRALVELVRSRLLASSKRRSIRATISEGDTHAALFLQAMGFRCDCIAGGIMMFVHQRSDSLGEPSGGASLFDDSDLEG
jgi:GNAT superfamily N-acetyltransferase